MNKSDFIDVASSKAQLTKKDMAATLEATLETITEALAKGDSIAFIGFGTFSTTTRATREGRNPSTGETMTIPEATVAKFKAGSKLKEAVKK